MKSRATVVMVLALFLTALTACEQIKELTGAGEEKAEESAPEEEEKPAAEEPAKEDEASKKATAEAEKAKEEAEQAKAEAEKAREEAEKAKEEAEDEKDRVAEKAARQAITKDLAQFTAEVLNLKSQVTVARSAWQQAGDVSQDAEFTNLFDQFTTFDNERAVVEGLMVQGKLDEAQTKLEVLKARFPALKQAAQPLLAKKPLDPKKWEAMLDILAAETCLMQKNLPAQEFQQARDALFGQFGLDRVTYEQLRAQFSQNSKPEDQALLSKKVAEACPATPAGDQPAEGTGEATAEGTGDVPADGTDEAATDEPAEGTDEAATDEPAEGTDEAATDEPAEGTDEAATDEPAEKDEGETATDEPAEKDEGETATDETTDKDKTKTHSSHAGKYAGRLLVPGKRGNINLTVKSNKLNGTAKIPGATLKLAGKLTKGKGSFTGKSGSNNLKCSARVTASSISGKCSGNIDGRSLKNIRYTARKK